MKTRTLAQLRARARLHADQRVADETNAFVTKDELNTLINDRLDEFYDLIVAARGHEKYATDDTVTLVGGTAGYDLPDDFYQLLAVTIEWESDDHEPVQDLNSLQDAWRYANLGTDFSRWSDKAYRLLGDEIVFYPTPQAAATVRLHYVPVRADLENDSDTFDGVNGWDKLVTLGAAIDLLEIEEQGSGLRLEQRFQAQKDRIEGLAADRDAAQEMQVRDVRRRRYPRYPSATGTTQ